MKFQISEERSRLIVSAVEQTLSARRAGENFMELLSRCYCSRVEDAQPWQADLVAGTVLEWTARLQEGCETSTARAGRYADSTLKRELELEGMELQTQCAVLHSITAVLKRMDYRAVNACMLSPRRHEIMRGLKQTLPVYRGPATESERDRLLREAADCIENGLITRRTAASLVRMARMGNDVMGAAMLYAVYERLSKAVMAMVICTMLQTGELSGEIDTMSTSEAVIAVHLEPQLWELLERLQDPYI